VTATISDEHPVDRLGTIEVDSRPKIASSG
jgi:hypothetical protein